MYHYLMYGLHVDSVYKFYNIPETEGLADVVIRFGTRGIDDIEFYRKRKNMDFSPSLTEFFCSLGFFSVRNGNEIVVVPADGYSDDRILATINGWCMGILLTQRGYSVLHGSAIEYNGKCFVISGVSGAGKSTTALELLKRGGRYLADDLVAIDVKNGCRVIPSFPVQKVCADVADRIGSEKLYHIDEDRDKYAYLNVEQFLGSPMELSDIFWLTTDDVPELKMSEITGLNKYLKIFSCLFITAIYAENGLAFEEKQRCLEIVGHCRLFNVIRPKNRNTLEQICDNILMTVSE